MAKKSFFYSLFGLLLTLGLSAADIPRTPSPEEAVVYIVSPVDGAVVEGELKVIFGLSGMGIAPAGVNVPHTGHHHLLIDMEELPAMNLPMPASDHLKHFGKGQTEVVLSLKPGVHTLQLVLGDKIHLPHDKPVISKKITITVK